VQDRSTSLTESRGADMNRKSEERAEVRFAAYVAGLAAPAILIQCFLHCTANDNVIDEWRRPLFPAPDRIEVREG
jgi:hypothetical protein